MKLKEVSLDLDSHPSLAAARDAGGSSKGIRMEEQQLSLSALPPADVQEHMSLGLDQLSLVEAQAHGQECFPWQGDSSDAASWSVRPLRGKGGGEEDGEGWMATVGGSH